MKLSVTKSQNPMSQEASTFNVADGRAPVRASNPKTVRRAIADDRKFFLRHPRRTVRLRDPVPGEAEAMAAGTEENLPAVAQGYPLRIVVESVGPGLRCRHPVWTVLDASAPEEEVLAFMRLLSDGQAQGYVGEFTGADLLTYLGKPDGLTRH